MKKMKKRGGAMSRFTRSVKTGVRKIAAKKSATRRHGRKTVSRAKKTATPRYNEEYKEEELPVM